MSRRIFLFSGNNFTLILLSFSLRDFSVALTSLRKGIFISLICLLKRICFVLGNFLFVHSFVALINPTGIVFDKDDLLNIRLTARRIEWLDTHPVRPLGLVRSEVHVVAAFHRTIREKIVFCDLDPQISGL